MASGRTAFFVLVAGPVVFAAGLAVGLFYGGHSDIHWNNDLGWQPIATIAAAVLTCLTVVGVAWAITTRLQQRQSDKAFERELLAGFLRTALASAAFIHEHMLRCRKRNSFGEEERQSFVLLFTAVGQDLQLIQDTITIMSLEVPTVDAAQQCRSEYKDLLTDRAVGEVFTPGDEHEALVKYRELRKHLVELIVQVNRSS